MTTPVKVKKLGHVVLTVSDIERTVKFWTEIMGFQVSDRNEQGMVFLRYGSDHHTVALVQAKTPDELPKEGRPGFHHCALEVSTVSELFKIRDFSAPKECRSSTRDDAVPEAIRVLSLKIPMVSTSSSMPQWIRSARTAKADRLSSGVGPRPSRRPRPIRCLESSTRRTSRQTAVGGKQQEEARLSCLLLTACYLR